MEKHEGVAYERDIALCFASLGDLPNVLRSVTGLSENYSGAFTCVVNGEDLLVAVRNIMIPMAPMLLPPRKAAGLMLRLWYSAQLTPEVVDVISHIRTLITATKDNLRMALSVKNRDLTFGFRSLPKASPHRI